MTINYFRKRSVCLLGAVFLTHMVTGISVASTPAPYTASSPSNEYASPTTPESATPDYNNQKYSNPLYPYARPVYDPMYNSPNSHLTDSFTPYSNLLSPRPFLFHRLPSLFNAPVHNPHSPHNPESTPYPFNAPSYPTQSGFVPSQPYEPLSYPYTYPKYPKNPYVSSCDYQQLPQPYRNTKPFFYYPQRQDNFYDYAPPSKPSDAQYRYQPAQPAQPAQPLLPPYGNNFANNVYP